MQTIPTVILKNRLYSLLDQSFVPQVKKAVEYAEHIYSNKYRYDGEEMVRHTIKVAQRILEEGFDINTAIAALLHEIVLTEEIEKELTSKFSNDVVEILRGIRNIKKGTDSTETNNEVIIKYILNCNRDLRPLILKIYDGIEDINTMENVPIEKMKETLNKFLNIYGILCEYLFLQSTKKELEEKAFEYYLPAEYQSISKKMKELNIGEELKEKYFEIIKECTRNLPNKAKIDSRIKNKYSIYNKLKKYEKEWIDPNINSLQDLIAFRIIVKNEDECFLVLEKLMDKGEIDEEGFDDYISNPKPNGYKAIQFPIKFPAITDIHIEVQILTEDMYENNTFGSASHIAYKASKSRFAKITNKYDWVKDVQKQIKNNRLRVKKEKNLPILCNIFEDEAFPFTPKGMIIALNNGDTVLDFAYKLHTSIGNAAETAKVNEKPAKLGQVLKTGDIVDIRTDKNKSYQKESAIQYANSSSTKYKILKYYTKALKS